LLLNLNSYILYTGVNTAGDHAIFLRVYKPEKGRVELGRGAGSNFAHVGWREA
jgi:hypothetical protein